MTTSTLKSSLLPGWIKAWLASSAIICAIDVAFTALRPATLRGGSLSWLFTLWNIYADVDARYATANDVVTHATGRLMVIEIALNIAALLMNRRQSKHTLLTAFTSSVLVMWKTVIYLALYIDLPEGNVSHLVEGTPLWKEVLVFWVMNSIWVFVPLMVVCSLWKRIVVRDDSQSVSVKEILIAARGDE